MSVAEKEKAPLLVTLQAIGLDKTEAEEVWIAIRRGHCQDTFVCDVAPGFRLEIHLPIGGLRVRAFLNDEAKPSFEQYLWLPGFSALDRHRFRELAEAYDAVPGRVDKKCRRGRPGRSATQDEPVRERTDASV